MRQTLCFRVFSPRRTRGRWLTALELIELWHSGLEPTRAVKSEGQIVDRPALAPTGWIWIFSGDGLLRSQTHRTSIKRQKNGRFGITARRLRRREVLLHAGRWNWAPYGGCEKWHQAHELYVMPFVPNLQIDSVYSFMGPLRQDDIKIMLTFRSWYYFVSLNKG
jgi:hypothetical protein